MIDIDNLTVPAFVASNLKEICSNSIFQDLEIELQERIRENFLENTTFFTFKEKNYHMVEISNNNFIIIQEHTEPHQTIRESTRHSMALQMRILNELGEGVFIQDKNEKIIFLNPSAEKTLGLAAYEIVGKSFLDFITPEEEKIRVNRLTQKLLGETLDTKSIRFETQIKNKQSEIIYLLVYYSVMWSNKTREGALITIYDISDIRKLTKEIQERSNELLQAEKLTSIGLLASGISHELNNPLSFIISNTTTLEDYIKTILIYLDRLEEKNDNLDITTNTEIKEIIEIKKEIFSIFQANQRGLTRLSDVISDLRKFSHSNQQDAENKTEVIDAVEPIKLALNLLSYEIKQIDVQFQFENKEIKYLINGNAKLYQIFLNIIYNASQAIKEKFNNEKSGIIKIHIFEQNSKVVIQITDNGKGIEEKNLPRLFDPFYTTKPPGIGTGLGLSISQRIINDLGGYIVAESGTILSGATFTLYFPAIEEKI